MAYSSFCLENVKVSGKGICFLSYTAGMKRSMFLWPEGPEKGNAGLTMGGSGTMVIIE